jgi:hypothetical protein
VRIGCHSSSAIFLAKNPAHNSKTKHIAMQYNYMVEKNKLLLYKVDTLNNFADSLTKFVSIEIFSWCRESMGIIGPNS